MEAVGAKHRSSIHDVIKRVATTGNTKTANRRREKYKTTPRDERHLVFLARKHPEDSFSTLAKKADLQISTKTCKKILQRHHLGNWRKAKRILLTEDNAAERLAFAKKYVRADELKKLLLALFLDECTVTNSPGFNGRWVFRFANERYRRDLVDPGTHGKLTLSIMVWGMVWSRDGEGGRSPLVFCKGDLVAPR
ncbi:putative Tc1-like transposase DDE domain-containing protein [Seiridium cardinale]|uniref:Tc1-like transposase DDE domain-containing protein n=1 Tax=Seiridium cardinale TaxID=138064 RepID=A0ABR2Y1B0_9PEZI